MTLKEILWGSGGAIIILLTDLVQGTNILVLDGGTTDRQIIVNGCYVHHNTYGIGSSYELLAINCKIADNSTDTSGNVTVI